VSDPFGLDRVCAFLDAWPHPAAVVGGLAVVLRVRPRLTRDVDLVAVVPDDRRVLLDHLRASGYVWNEDDIEEWLDGGLVRARCATAALDVIVADDPFLVDVARRAEPVTVEGRALPVATLEDLLLLKLEAGRPQDLDDALAIKDAFADRLDKGYLRAAGSRIGVDAVAFLRSEE
jgi:predicted nucleotidyltransferase